MLLAILSLNVEIEIHFQVLFLRPPERGRRLSARLALLRREPRGRTDRQVGRTRKLAMLHTRCAHPFRRDVERANC